jgi:uncharacterized membrane protein
MNDPAISLAGQARIEKLAGDERMAWVAYVMHFLGLFLLWPSLIAIIINYAKRGRNLEPNIDSHHSGMLRTFWIFSIVSCVLVVVMIGIVVAWVISLGIDLSVLDDGGRAFEQAHPEFKFESWRDVLPHLAYLGSIGLVAVLLLIDWFWALIRFIIGVMRLADDQPA